VKHLISIALLMLIFVTAGCVSTGSSGRDKALDKQQIVDAHVQLGMNYVSVGNRESARNHFKKALEVDPASPGAYNGLALLNQLNREDDLAENNYRKAISLDKNYTRVRFNYAAFLFGRERFREAYEQFVIVGRDHNYDRRAQSFLNQGLCLIKLSRRAEAREAFLKSNALNPKLASAYLELSDFYFVDGDYPASIKHLKIFEQLSRPTARSLWLGIRLARIFGDRDSEASKVLALKKLFSDSREHLEYQRWLRSNE